MEENLNPREQLSTMMEHLDANADKSIDAQERKELSVEYRRKAFELKLVLDGEDDLKKQALTMAVINVSSQYKGVSALDIFNMIAEAEGYVIDLGSETFEDEVADDLVREPASDDFYYSGAVDVIAAVSNFAPVEYFGAQADGEHLNTRLRSASGERPLTDQSVYTSYDDLLDGSIDMVKSQSLQSKFNLILLIGNEGLWGYSRERQSAPLKGDRVSINQFMQNLRRRRTFDRRVDDLRLKFASWQGNPARMDRDVDRFLTDAAKDFGLDKDGLKKLWDKTGGSFDNFVDEVTKEYFKLGVCRDIAALQAFVASDIGIKDAFMTSTTSSGAAHVVAGGRDEKGHIVFFDYDRLVPTNTANMKVALKTLEVYERSVSLSYLQGKGGYAGYGLIPVRSAASDVLHQIARGKSGDLLNEVGEGLDAQGLPENGSGLDFQVEKGRTNLELTLPFLAGTTIVSATYHNTAEDAANSIAAAYSGRLANQWGGENVQAGFATAYSNMLMKTYDDVAGPTRLNELLLDLYAKTHLGFEADHFRYRLMATMDMIGHWGLNNQTFASAEANIATGQRFSLFTSDFEAFLDLKSEHSLVPESIQSASANPKTFVFIADLLAANLGFKVGVGSFSGHRAVLRTEVQAGGKYLDVGAGTFPAAEYKGRVGLTAEKSGVRNMGLDLEASYVDTSDFRLNQEARGKVSAHYGMGSGPGTYLELRVFGFQNKSLGKFQDSDLDQIGAGFEGVFKF